jgi:hypothetical protein
VLSSYSRGTPEPFEAEHYVRSVLDVSMILLDQVVQVLRGPNKHPLLFRYFSTTVLSATGPIMRPRARVITASMPLQGRTQHLEGILDTACRAGATVVEHEE